MTNDAEQGERNPLSQLSAGDEVYVAGEYGNVGTIQRVERITATQIIVGANRYRRTNGYEVGGGVWRSGGIAILTDALRAAVRRKKAMEALRALTPIVGKNTISTENIEAAVKLLTPSGGPTE